jgi:outer membrane protein TolC
MTNFRGPKRLGCFLALILVLAANAQGPPDRTPGMTYGGGFIRAYRPGSVAPVDYRDSPRIKDLIRAGQLYLSLEDAIALALENNLDLELVRYNVRQAQTDTLRAQGGGLLRGVLLTTNEAPAGVGGLAAPLNNSAATGTTPQTSVPASVTDSQLIDESQTNLAVLGPYLLSNGPGIPQFDPSLNVQFLAQHLSTPETSTLVTGTPSLNSNVLTGNFSYVQGFSAGTQVTASFQNTRTDSNSSRNIIDPYENSSLGVTVTQPLLRGFGVEMNRRFIRIAQNTEKMSINIFRYQAAATITGVVRLYTDLVSLNEDLLVKQETFATAQRLVDDNANKVEQGTLAPVELTRARAQLASAHEDLINSEGFVRQQELILKDTLTRNSSGDPFVHAARIIPTDPIVVDDVPKTPVEELVRTALENRQDYQAAKLQVANSEISLKGSRNELRPELDLVANASNSGLAGAANPTFSQSSALGGVEPQAILGYAAGYGSVLDQILRRNYPSYSVGINLTLPFRNRTAQADLARDEVQVRLSQVRTKQLENQIRVEVEDAIIALERTRAVFDAAVETRKLQEQSFELEQERFDVGLSTNFLVIQYQSYVAQARSSEVAARGAYAKARAQLQRVTGVVLVTHNITVDEALRGQSPRVSTPAVPPARQ